MWIDKDSLQMLKIAVNATMAPPTGEDSGGVNSITLAMTVSLTGLNEPVNVTAPAGAKPWEQFQKDIEANPSLLGPLGAMGLSGSGTDLGGIGLDGATTDSSISY
jgi:hypothetical protein